MGMNLPSFIGHGCDCKFAYVCEQVSLCMAVCV